VHTSTSTQALLTVGLAFASRCRIGPAKLHTVPPPATTLPPGFLQTKPTWVRDFVLAPVLEPLQAPEAAPDQAAAQQAHLLPLAIACMQRELPLAEALAAAFSNMGLPVTTILVVQHDGGIAMASGPAHGPARGLVCVMPAARAAGAATVTTSEALRQHITLLHTCALLGRAPPAPRSARAQDSATAHDSDSAAVRRATAELKTIVFLQDAGHLAACTAPTPGAAAAPEDADASAPAAGREGLDSVPLGSAYAFANSLHLERPHQRIRVVNMPYHRHSQEIAAALQREATAPGTYAAAAYRASQGPEASAAVAGASLASPAAANSGGEAQQELHRFVLKMRVVDPSACPQRTVQWTAEDVVIVSGGGKGELSHESLARPLSTALASAALLPLP
jgi:hypothetical protein